MRQAAAARPGAAAASLVESFSRAHGIPLVGDATSVKMLRRAGIERARGLVTVAASDADNLSSTLRRTL